MHKEINENESKNNPFSTKDIKITNAPITLFSLIDKLKFDEIDLNPDFQRNADLWDNTRMSRLIESILLKLPLPVFYFDVKDDTKWIVVDGLQRLSTLKKFIIGDDKGKKLKLRDLEFLKHLNGKFYDDLDRPLQRIIDATQVITYQIEAQTPKEVRYSIFNRINTGGLSLNAQEIRQALNQKNQGVSFLKEITEIEVFKNVVKQNPKRMRDREVVLIFLLFKLGLFEEYEYSKIQKYLDKAMEKVDSIVDDNKFLELKNNLINTLTFIIKIFGNDFTFSLSIADKNLSKTFNQSIFDVITVTFSEIEDKEKFLDKKDVFLQKFKDKVSNEDDEFRIAITKGTSDRNTILTRFKIMRNLIDEVLNEN
ncbi:MAG TPA: DUF262 domain-containing protein [Flavobacteriaceae bacterium]|nr:DUF262 domain-containing protein [Flavobacteriaceae bacterium]